MLSSHFANATIRCNAAAKLVYSCAACRLVPTRSPVGFLTRVPGGLALRANLEVLQKAHNFATVVATILSPIQRFYAKLGEGQVDYI